MLAISLKTMTVKKNKKKTSSSWVSRENYIITKDIQCYTGDFLKLSECKACLQQLRHSQVICHLVIVLQYYISKAHFALVLELEIYCTSQVLQECLWLNIKSALLSSRCSWWSNSHVLCGNNWHHSLGKNSRTQNTAKKCVCACGKLFLGMPKSKTRKHLIRGNEEKKLRNYATGLLKTQRFLMQWWHLLCQNF